MCRSNLDLAHFLSCFDECGEEFVEVFFFLRLGPISILKGQVDEKVVSLKWVPVWSMFDNEDVIKTKQALLINELT